jgi:xanthine/CO dehydrogenase XdhC/CoxF family maturation factor
MRKIFCLFALASMVMELIAAHAWPQAKPASGFDRLKTLVGKWEAAAPLGGTLTNTIRLVSNGTALEETFQSSEADQMVTLYTADGNRLAMTHYCAAGNQPRMATQAVTADQKEFDFSFAGTTNLMSSNSGHMHHLVIQMADQDHFTEQWTWRENGKDRTTTIHFTRSKP